MSFFGSKLFGLGGGTGGQQTNGSSTTSSVSGADTIERLCDRVQSALLIEDRRDSLKEMKSLSKKYKLEVGTLAMPVLIDVLRQNKMDSELCCLALDILQNIFTNEENSQQETSNLPADISSQFTEMFAKDTSNIELLFDLLDEFDFKTRWSTLKLLNSLILNQCEQLQEIILQIPRGVSRLIDLLNDSREIIRNDAILLLNNLTKTNANIQKIIAFESGFDRIMEIIDSEGSALDGGVVVEDCFNLLLNLLQTNTSNQSFFKEANYIKQFCKYFDLNSASSSSNKADTNNQLNNSDTNSNNNNNVWTLQKTTNLSLLLKLIRCLVAPNNQQQIIADCQKAYNHFGLLHRLSAMLLLPGLPAELLSEAISTVGEVIRGNKANQQLFSTVMMPSNPPRPLIIILLMSMINEKQPFHLRCSILYCFQCYLFKNEEKKAEIIETLLPNNKSSPQQLNAGQILCSGLFNINDYVSNWLCAIALSHTINDSNLLKEQLLRVQLAINNNNNNNQETVQAVSLMQQCMNMLIDSIDPNSASSAGHQLIQNHRLKFQTVISILMFLSTWLANCPTAVNHFLSHQQNIPYLISQVSSTDTEEKSLIIQGLSSYLLGLNMLYNTNQIQAFTVVNLKDTIKKRIGIEQFEDKLEYISQHERYTKTLKKTTFNLKFKTSADLLFDHEFARLFKSNESSILSLLNGSNSTVQNNQTNTSNNNIIDNKSNMLQLEQQNSIINQYQNIIREQDNKLKEQYHLNQMLTQTCTQLQENCQQMAYKLNELNNNPNLLPNNNSSVEYEKQFLAERLQYQSRINELEVKNNLLEEKCSEQEDELCKVQREKGILQETINNLQTNDKNTDIIELRTQNKDLKTQIQNLNQEQDNLLVLLQEMEEKLKKYKKILRSYNYNKLSDDDDEEKEEALDKPTVVEHKLNEENDKNHQFETATNLLFSSASQYQEINNLNNHNNEKILHTNSLYLNNNSLNNSGSDTSSEQIPGIYLKPNYHDDDHHGHHHFNGNQDTSTSTSGSSGNNSIDQQYNMSQPPPVGQNFSSLDLTNNFAQMNIFQNTNLNNNPNENYSNNNNNNNNLQNYFN